MFENKLHNGASMKKLYIVRHSKAVEFAPDHSDFNRCLAEYGVEKANRIAEELAGQITGADLILSSPACRALETAQIFARALDYPESAIQQEKSLYHFGGIHPILDIISEISEEVETLMVFGHNPTFTALAWQLCETFRESMPTSAVVGIELKIPSWSTIGRGESALLTYLTRKSLK